MEVETEQPVRKRRPEKFCHNSWLHREWISDPARRQQLFDYLMQNGEWQDRDANHMQYRGWRLKRAKFFLVDDPEEPPEILRVYHYPGRTINAIAHT